MKKAQFNLNQFFSVENVKAMFENQEDLHVSISKGNTKMGAIPSVSLPPIVTCPKGAPCCGKCYAAKMCRNGSRKTIREAYARNYFLLMFDPAKYWREVRGHIALTRYFRFHVSGDIPTAEYFGEMVKTAEMFPMTEILAFTKQYAIVNDWIAEHGDLPSNLHIVFSAWSNKIEIPNPYNLPVAEVIEKDWEKYVDTRKWEVMESWKICGGNCFECVCRGIGCWNLKHGETIAFYEH